ncbi:MAG: DUF4831 family protein [Dysgonamonadaceae bacterium]|jgi:hypothetical protein|nr:DUF4831 family protein [Dysgonamonadaceae bacterium]
MKSLNVLLLLLLFTFTPLAAQTKVIKMSATKSAGYGVEYFLPKTVLTVNVEYSKITQKAGIYAKYAGKFLGLDEKSIIPEDRIYYRLDKINVESKGIPDKKESYLVEFKAKTTAPFVYLTEDGLICTINAEYETPKSAPQNVKTGNIEKLPVVNVQSLFTEEYLRAGSTLKMAEIAAKQIYKLRESRNDMLTGDAENAPRDGEGMKLVLATLEAQEKAMAELFMGTTSVEKFDSEFEVEPVSDLNKEVLFRFSKYLGLVDANDLSGNPVYINVIKTDEENLDVEPDPKKKAKEPESIVYNVPEKASVEILYESNSLYKNTIQVAQFGKKQILATSLFDDKKAPVKVYFYPSTGAIKQIIQ